MHSAKRKRSKGRSLPSVWPTTSANSARRRCSDCLTRWCSCSPGGECLPASSWAPWLEANCLLRTGIMAVTQDAQGLAKGERAVVRERVVGHGHGKNATQQRLRTELVGVPALTSYDSYGEAEQTKSAHRCDYSGQPINAVVVRRWENRVPKGGGTVYLTNGQVSDTFSIFDTYDSRSVIENGIFQQGKHPWHLLRFPKRTEAAVVVHCFFTLLVMGLCTAFRLWQAQVATTPTSSTEVVLSLSSALLAGQGTEGWLHSISSFDYRRVVHLDQLKQRDIYARLQ